MTNQIVPGGFFFIFRDFNISEISLIVNSIIANFEFVLNSKLGGLQLLSSKFDMEQKKLFRRLHLSISSTYKISFSVSKRGGIVQLRPTLPISFLTRDQNNLGSDEFSSRKSFELRKNCCFAWIIIFYWFGMVRRKLTIPERWQAVGMHNGGFSHRRVADHFRVNHSIIVRLMQRFRQTGNVTDRPRAGIPRKTTPREDRLISRRSRQRPFSTADALRGNLAFEDHINLAHAL